MLNKTINTFLSKDVNTRRNQYNIILIMILRGAGILCSFLLVPIMLKYLDKNNFGIWLTLTSITSWISFMDVGLGNGLRNKLTEANTSNNRQLAVEYVSTTYGIFSLIVIVLLVFFVIINPFINWTLILKTDLNRIDVLILTYTVIISFCIRLILDLAGVIVTSLHKPYIKSIVDFLTNFIVLAVAYSLSIIAYRSFILFGLALCVTPIIILIFFSIILFRKKSVFSYLKPSLKYFKKAHLNSLLNLGFQFFIIQISALIVFSTDNILITQLYSPADVTRFNISYKLFSIITIVFNIVLIPYWSSFTSAYIESNFTWIKSTFKKLIIIWLIQVIGVFVLILLAENIYKVWVGNSSILIPLSLNISLGCYVIIANWNNIYVYFLNGISKIRLQLFSSIIIGTINIPLSYYLSKYTTLGVSSIVVSNCICLLICSAWAPVQCYKIVMNKASGVWNR